MRVINADTLKSILANLPSNPRIIASGNFATPQTLLAVADEVIPRFKLHVLNAIGKGIPDREGITYETSFIGPVMRNHPRLEYIPSRLSLCPVLINNFYRPDVVFIHTSAIRFDTVSLGIEVNILPRAIETARANGGLVIAQSNVQMPYTYGDAQIHETDIDYLIEVDEPLQEKPTNATITDLQAEIGSHIVELIEDHSTLHTGIGSVTDAVLMALKQRKGLRIWSETFSDGVLELSKAGALDDELIMTTSFISGSQELYDWVHLNKKIRVLRTERTNDSNQIARQSKMISFNAALEVDLFDQANASHVNGRIYSGFGGSTNFNVGALHSRGGKAFVILPSWHSKTNTSTIVPRLESHVTHFQHSFIVTEQGVAACFGHSQSDQAMNIIKNAAHPSVRDELTEKATEYGLL